MARHGQLEDVDGDSGPIRLCALTRTRLPIDGLIRFVLDPQDQVVPDLRRRLPGRGVWIAADAASVREAQRRKIFARAFRKPVVTPLSLADQIDGLIAGDCLQSLSMAKKAGLVITGFAKVEAALRTASVAVRVEAADAARDGRAKLDRIASMRFGAGLAPAVVDLFDTAQLSLALGRENVIHAVALAGAASDAFVKRCLTLATFRIDHPATGTGPVGVTTGNSALAKQGTDQESVENE